jgi:hypothetical protein
MKYLLVTAALLAMIGTTSAVVPLQSKTSYDYYLDVRWNPQRPDWKGLVMTNTGRRPISIVSVALKSKGCVLWRDSRRQIPMMTLQDLADRYAKRTYLKPGDELFLQISSASCRPVYGVDVQTDETNPIHIDFDRPYMG